MIKLTCIGHLGKDATENKVNDKTVINFSVAHTEKYKDTEKTIWVECSYWIDKTGILPYLKKGTQVYVEGQPEIRTWGDTGNTKASLTCRVMSVQLLGSKQNSSQQQTASIPVNDDLPF